MDYKEQLKRLIDDRFEDVKYKTSNKVYETELKDVRNKYKYACIFGMGSLGQEMLFALRTYGVKVDFVCDNNFNNIKDKYIDEPRAISFNELCDYKDNCLVYISPANGLISANDDINRQLEEAGFKHIIKSPIWKNMRCLLKEIIDLDRDYFSKKIMEIIDWCEDDASKDVIIGIVSQMLADYKELDVNNDIESLYDRNHYFISEIKSRKDECFVDAGAFSGDTFEAFYKWTNGIYEKYYGFELEKSNRDALDKCISLIEADKSKIEVYEYGLFNKNEKVKIYPHNDGSYIDSMHLGDGYEKYEYAEVKPLDDCLKGKKVTFIKMDIENSEIPAIFGAKEIITEQKPVCAISVYHGLKQFIEVPGILKAMNPEYRLWYRVHSSVGHDIVCYAVDKNDFEHMVM